MQFGRLTESEELVMKAVWDSRTEPVLSDIVAHVETVFHKDWKPQTVSTFLSKLCQKKFLKLIRNGKVYTYQVLVPEKTYRKKRLSELLMFYYDHDYDSLQDDVNDFYGK